LPLKFQNQLIHAETGHNVVRSYIIENRKQANTAKVKNIIKSKDDWLDPDDVSNLLRMAHFLFPIGTDGGVGGHKGRKNIAQVGFNRCHNEKYDLAFNRS